MRTPASDSAREPRLGKFLWVIFVIDAIAVVWSLAHGSSWRVNMLLVTIGTLALIAGLTWIVARPGLLRFAQISVAALSIPIWQFALSNHRGSDFLCVLATEIGSLPLAFLLMPATVVAFVAYPASVGLIVKLAGWKRAPVVFAAVCVPILLASYFPIGLGHTRGRAQVAEDPAVVHWSSDSRYLLYLDSPEAVDEEYDTTLFRLDLSTGYRRRYPLPRSMASPVNDFALSHDNRYVAFVIREDCNVWYIEILDLKTGRVRKVYTARNGINIEGWPHENRLLFSLQNDSRILDSSYSFSPDGKHKPQRTRLIAQESYQQPADRSERSPDGRYYYHIEARGGGDWYNSVPDPLWVGEVVK